MPPAWASEVTAEKSAESLPSTIDQLALALMLESGGYDRHLRAGRSRYRQRRDVLVRQLGAIPDAGITGTAAGLHLVLRLPDGTDTAAVVAAAASRGLLVTDLDDYRAARAGPPGLVLGYGNIATPDVPDAVAVLAAAIAVAEPAPTAPRGR